MCPISRMATGQLADAAANSSVGTSKIINFCCAYFALLLCAREVGDADNDEKINQQNIVSFLPARRYLARILAVVVCLSARLSVRPSASSRCSTETAKHRNTQTSHTIGQGL